MGVKHGLKTEEIKMRNDLTDVTLVIDRSGSMASRKKDAEGGINTFVNEQKKQPGECLLSLVQFDTDYEFVHRGIKIQDVPAYTLVPRGWTALLDAVGRAINETGDRLAAMPEDQRPGLVIVAIVTDGEENSSREFTKAQIKQMVERQTNEYSWQFTFLGANQDAFAEARQLGISRVGTCDYNPQNSVQAYRALSDNVSRMRTASAQGTEVMCCYTEDERKAMS